MKIQAITVADSLSPQGHRIWSGLLTFPRFILAELNTHRMLSKNSASSRAIPTHKLIEMIKTNPFIPIAWQENHKGMQGVKYHTDIAARQFNQEWLIYRDQMILAAEKYNMDGATKQLANRVLEPFMWHTVLITGTEWENFFELRCPDYKPDFDRAGSYRSIKQMAARTAGTNLYYMIDDNRYWNGMQCTFVEALTSGLNKGQAEIHMMALAEAIWDAQNESKPKQLEAGEWHIPFEDMVVDLEVYNLNFNRDIIHLPIETIIDNRIKLATAMAARTSYTVVGDEKEVSYETLLGIHDKMAVAKPFHASPFEHCAKAMSNIEYKMHLKGYVDNTESQIVEFGWCRNYRGFIQYRHTLEEQLR